MSSWQGKKTLITGINGFVGGNLAESLVSAGAEVTGLERNLDHRSYLHHQDVNRRVRLVRGDLCDRSCMERIVAEGTFDYYFHLAAQVEVGVGMQSPFTTFETNIRGTYTLLEAIRSVGREVKAVVVASTDKAYGEYPVSAMPYRETYPLRPQYPYDTSKACADMIAQCYSSDAYRLPIVITRFCNIFGPGQLNFSALIPDAVRASLGFGTFIPRGNGSHVRDFIFVKDVVRLYMRIAEALSSDPVGFRGRAYNAGTNEPKTVREIVRRIFLRCGKEDELATVIRQMENAKTTGEISTQYMDYDVVYRDFGWKPTTSLDDGLDQTIEWFRDFLATQDS